MVYIPLGEITPFVIILAVILTVIGCKAASRSKHKKSNYKEVWDGEVHHFDEENPSPEKEKGLFDSYMES